MVSLPWKTIFLKINISNTFLCQDIWTSEIDSVEKNWVHFWFCTRILFSEDFQLANDYGTIRKYVFIAISAWWLSHFSTTSHQNSLVFRCERISSLTSLLQIICIRMQCWLDDRIYFISRDSLQAISEERQRGRKITNNIEILLHLHQTGK
jgi:hypothetical protein